MSPWSTILYLRRRHPVQRPYDFNWTDLRITASNLEGIDAPYSEEEVKVAIMGMSGDKAPGPDGFTNEFYKAFKSLLKDDLLKFFEDFHDNRAALCGINCAFIMLLLKTDTSLEMRDFRPISLVHSAPKLVSKVMTNRLQKRIPDLVQSLQSGFLRGRSIVENFALAAEMIQAAHKRKLPVIALKLDLCKAFDSVSWDCLA